MKKISLIILVFSLLVVLSACGLSLRRGDSLTTASGIFVSNTQGNTWKNMSFMPSASGEPISLTHLDIKKIVVDPSDHQALYLTTYDRGLFFTYNLNNGWQKVESLATDTIQAVAIDPKFKCTIYAAINNRLYKSQDCNRNWQQVYFDNNPEVLVTSVVVDHYNSDNIYITTSRGEVIKSIDRANSWRTIHRFNNGVFDLKMSPQDSRLLFLATDRNEFFSFNSPSITSPEEVDSDRLEKSFSVTNLTNLSEVLADIRRTNIREINICSQEGVIILATEQKILRSPDNGISWAELDLIPSEADAAIKAVAINPQNSQEIYYVTDTTFYRSLDGGITWNTRRLPTARIGSSLLVNPSNPQLIYLGVRKEN